MGCRTFTLLHVAISLVGIVTGLVALAEMLGSRGPSWWTHVFLVTTLLTSVTGFMFPINGFTPALGTGIVSMVVLALALAGLYVFRLAGAWRRTYVTAAIAALYLNCFVLVVQAFQKVPVLVAIAPTQSEPPFLIAQGALLVAFLFAGYRAVRTFHPLSAQARHI